MCRHIVLARGRRISAAVLFAVLALAATPASGAASTLYVNFGDSVGAGWLASSGHGYFDLYCAYLESSGAVSHCINEAVVGATSQSALTGGMVQKVVNDIESSTDTPIVTVSLGGNDLLAGSSCQPVTLAGCPFIHNMRTILNQLETALATRPGAHQIKWLEYYNPNHDNPHGDSSRDQATAQLMLGDDVAYTPCSSTALNLIGLDDAINCLSQEKGATPVDAYAPFQLNCTQNDCFADSVHPDDKGYGLIFDAFRDTAGSPVPATPPPDGTWPGGSTPSPPPPPGPPPIPPPPTLSRLSESRHTLRPATAPHKGSIRFAFRLDRTATLRISIARLAPGRRVGARCRPPSKLLGHKQPCTRAILIALFVTQQSATGHGRFVFTGRVHGHALKPGRYQATFTAANSGGVSPPQRLQFTVLAG